MHTVIRLHCLMVDFYHPLFQYCLGVSAYVLCLLQSTSLRRISWNLANDSFPRSHWVYCFLISQLYLINLATCFQVPFIRAASGAESEKVHHFNLHFHCFMGRCSWSSFPSMTVIRLTCVASMFLSHIQLCLNINDSLSMVQLNRL